MNPNIIADSKFKAGVTHQSLQDLGLSQNKITFEINERVSIQNEEYYSIATIKDLLYICIKAEIHAAVHATPLTKLPGNLLIEKELEKRLFGKKSYAIT